MAALREALGVKPWAASKVEDARAGAQESLFNPIDVFVNYGAASAGEVVALG